MAEPQENIQNSSNIQNNNIQSGSTFMDGNRTIDKVTFENEALRNFQGFFDTYKDNWSTKDQKAILDQYFKIMDAIHTGNISGRATTGKFIINNEESSGIDTSFGGPGEVIGYYLTQILNAMPSKEDMRSKQNLSIPSQSESPFMNTEGLNPPQQEQNEEESSPEQPPVQPQQPEKPTTTPTDTRTWEGYVDINDPEFAKAANLLAKSNGRDPSYYGKIKRVVSNGKNIYVGYARPMQKVRPLGQVDNRTPEQKANDRKVFQNGADGMEAEDWLRIGAMAQDVGALAASFAPGYGTAASGILGLTSMGTNLVADLNDESLSGWDVAKNAALNTGLAAIGLIPGGKAASLAKYAKLVPKILARANAIGLVFNDEVKKSLATLTTHPSELTNQDLRNLAYATSSLMGARRSHQDTKLQAKANGISNTKQRINEIKEVASPLTKVKRTQIAQNVSSKYQKTKAYVNGFKKKPAEGESRFSNAKTAAKEAGKTKESSTKKSTTQEATEQQTKGQQFKKEYEQKTNKWKEEHPTITKYAQRLRLKDNYEMAYGAHPTVAQKPKEDNQNVTQPKEQNSSQSASDQKTETNQSQQVQAKQTQEKQTSQKPSLEERRQEMKKLSQLISLSDSDRNLSHFRNVQKNKMSKEDLDRFDQLVAQKKKNPKKFRGKPLKELRSIISKYQGTYSARSNAYTRLNKIKKAQKAAKANEQAAAEIKGTKKTKEPIKRKKLRLAGPAGQSASLDRNGNKLELLLQYKKRGGIIKAQTGLKVGKYGYNTGIGLNNGTTWRGNVFNNYRNTLLDNISKYGQKYVDYINGRQDAHYGIYQSANKSGDWRKTAYWDPNNKVSDYQTEYNGGQYNNNFNQLGISKAAESGRYDLYGKRPRTSGDWSKENWKSDNLYSQITDDRRILGRRDQNYDDWDINSDDYKGWQKSLNDRGYEMYLDPQTNYYKIRPLNGQNQSQNGNNHENPGQLGANLNWKNKAKVMDYVNNFRKYVPDLLDFGRLLYNNRATNKRIDKYLTAIQPNLINGYSLYRRIYGDYATKNIFNNTAARIEQLGNRQALNTADQSLAYAAQQATQASAGENRAKGNLADNENIRNTYEKSLELAQQNIARENAVATANKKEMHDVERERANIEATRDAGITQNWNNWWMGRINQANIEKNKRDARQEYLDAIMLGTPDYDFTNDPIMSNAKIQYELAQQEGDTTKMNQIAQQLSQYRIQKSEQAKQDFYKRYAQKYGLHYEYKPTWKPSIAIAARGGVLDVSKYIARDNDRLIKSILKLIDNNTSLIRGMKQHREPQVKILK